MNHIIMSYSKVWVVIFFLCILAGPIAIAKKDDNKLVSFTASDYTDALGKAILFFEGQRSGKLPVSQKVKWRGDSALVDGKLENVNLIGGYYDAGDNVKFGWPMAFSLTLLSWAAVGYPTQISSANQLLHLQRAIRWGTNFLMRAHTSSTTLYTQVGDGNADHQCWERPEDMDTPRTLYKITSSSPGSEVAADVAAAFAAASIVFKKIDSNYSTELLERSKSLFAFADNYRGSYHASCPFYCSFSGYQDELLWAAAWLYKAGGGNTYLNYASNNQGWSQVASEFSWDNKFAGAQTLLAKLQGISVRRKVRWLASPPDRDGISLPALPVARYIRLRLPTSMDLTQKKSNYKEFLNGKSNLEKFKKDADSFICALMPGSSSIQIKTTPGGLLYIRDSSNLQYVTGATMVLLMYSKVLEAAGTGGVACGSVNFSTSKIKAFAKSQVDYILGNNPLKMSYMVSFGNKYPTQLHHRASSLPSIYNQPARVGCSDGYSSWYNSNNPNPNTHVGAIVGGPNSGDQFVDSRLDYSHSEPTTYMNAAFVGSVAALIGQSREAEHPGQINSQFNKSTLFDRQVSTKNISQ